MTLPVHQNFHERGGKFLTLLPAMLRTGQEPVVYDISRIAYTRDL